MACTRICVRGLRLDHGDGYEKRHSLRTLQEKVLERDGLHIVDFVEGATLASERHVLVRNDYLTAAPPF